MRIVVTFLKKLLPYFPYVWDKKNQTLKDCRAELLRTREKI